MNTFGREDLQAALAPKGITHPIIKRVRTHKTPFEIFSILQAQADHAYLLESVTGPRKLAEFSYIGFNPRLIIKAKGQRLQLIDPEGRSTIKVTTLDPLLELKDLLGERKVKEVSFRLIGGAVGYISYDAIRYWERLPKMAVDDLELPDLTFGLYDEGLVFDHTVGEVYYYTFNGTGGSSLLEPQALTEQDLISSDPKPNVSRGKFKEMVRVAKDYIVSGDIFQVVLSRRLDFRYRGSLLAFYRALRRVNPSPYMYYLKMGETAIIGSSPEMLVRVEKGLVETFPIAGTRPRTHSTLEDARLRRELLHDPKERAEHVMLVDLARNDLGRVSRFGTVEVRKFMKVHGFSHVQHIVSHVTGQLREDRDAFDALRAVFPAGTVSGAPKVRAMEIIEELEPCRRGPYAGAVGYFSYSGDADFAITIRTLVARGERAHVQAGAGIVADSVPEREWTETEHKARALIRALELARSDER